MTPTKAETLAECWINPDPKHPDDWFSRFERAGWVRFVPASVDQQAERDALLVALRNLCTSVRTSHNLDEAIGWADEAIAMAVFADTIAAARTSPVHQPVHGWTDADADAARLALELECLLTDRDTPMPLVSRWCPVQRRWVCQA